MSEDIKSSRWFEAYDPINSKWEKVTITPEMDDMLRKGNVKFQNFMILEKLKKYKQAHGFSQNNEDCSFKYIGDGKFVAYGLKTGKEYAESSDLINWFPVTRTP